MTLGKKWQISYVALFWCIPVIFLVESVISNNKSSCCLMMSQLSNDTLASVCGLSF